MSGAQLRAKDQAEEDDGIERYSIWTDSDLACEYHEYSHRLAEKKGTIKNSSNDSVTAATVDFNDPAKIIPEKTCGAQRIEDNSSVSVDESFGGSTRPELQRRQQPDQLAASRMAQSAEYSSYGNSLPSVNSFPNADDGCGIDNGFNKDSGSTNDNNSSNRKIDPALESPVSLITPDMAANFYMPTTWKRVPAAPPRKGSGF